MASTEVYNPEQWTNFFVLVGTGSAAALTGLVFVALSINVKGIAKDATQVIDIGLSTMLSGFTAVFIISSLALLGQQPYRTLGIEWLIVSLLAAGNLTPMVIFRDLDYPVAVMHLAPFVWLAVALVVLSSDH